MVPFLMIFLGDFLMTIYSAMGGLKAVVDGHYTVGVDYFEDISKVQKQHGLRCFGMVMYVGYRF